MMINEEDEKKVIKFLQDLVFLYDDHNVTTYQDYDYCGINVDGASTEFKDYKGEGFFSHYPSVDKEKLTEIGQRLFDGDFVKTTTNKDADKIYEASPVSYDLECRVYSDRVEYLIGAHAYNPNNRMFERRTRPVSPELFE